MESQFLKQRLQVLKKLQHRRHFFACNGGTEDGVCVQVVERSAGGDEEWRRLL